jgi:hypothetical protein
MEGDATGGAITPRDVSPVQRFGALCFRLRYGICLTLVAFKDLQAPRKKPVPITTFRTVRAHSAALFCQL